jgi:hypothetical protein
VFFVGARGASVFHHNDLIIQDHTVTRDAVAAHIDSCTTNQLPRGFMGLEDTADELQDLNEQEVATDRLTWNNLTAYQRVTPTLNN